MAKVKYCTESKIPNWKKIKVYCSFYRKLFELEMHSILPEHLEQKYLNRVSNKSTMLIPWSEKPRRMQNGSIERKTTKPISNFDASYWETCFERSTDKQQIRHIFQMMNFSQWSYVSFILPWFHWDLLSGDRKCNISLDEQYSCAFLVCLLSSMPKKQPKRIQKLLN